MGMFSCAQYAYSDTSLDINAGYSEYLELRTLTPL